MGSSDTEELFKVDDELKEEPSITSKGNSPIVSTRQKEIFFAKVSVPKQGNTSESELAKSLRGTTVSGDVNAGAGALIGKVNVQKNANKDPFLHNASIDNSNYWRSKFSPTVRSADLLSTSCKTYMNLNNVLKEQEARNKSDFFVNTNKFGGITV